jgi:serine phosphatase RsbU (regulator of sigma subunit)
MKENKSREKFYEAAGRLSALADIGFLELIIKDADSLKSLLAKTFDTASKFIQYDALSEKDKILSADAKPVKLIQKSENDKDINIASINIKAGTRNAFLILQSASPFNKGHDSLFEYLSAAGSAFESAIPAESGEEDGKYKKELVNMRYIQSQLFPKFVNIEGFDISSVYLPVDLMSGNFIDAMFIEPNTYQIVTCNVAGYDAAASFAGASIRTLVRSFSSAASVPSVLIQNIKDKMKSVISEISQNIFLTVYQLNIKTGAAKVSSLGGLTTFLYTKKSSRILNLKETPVGEDISKRGALKDISLNLDSGDAFLFYSNGVKSATSEDGRQLFGDSGILQSFKENSETSAMDTVHGMVQSIYEFTNYSKLEDDIILICIKKK